MRWSWQGRKIAALGSAFTGMPRMHTRNRTIWICVIAALPALTVGCARFDLRRNIPWQEVSDKPVQSVVVFWTEALIERRSAPPYRGFGGRVYFYPADMSRPMKVRGTLVVYAFDDNLPPPENLKPVRKFVFTNEELEKVYAESKLGPSYNILIPWDEFSPKAQRISLIARFIPENGPSVVSEQARVFLPGLDSSFLAGQSSQNGSTARPTSQATIVQDRAVVPTSVSQSGTGGSTGIVQAAGTAVAKDSQPSPRSDNPEAQRNQSQQGAPPRRRMQTLTLNLSRHGQAGPGSASIPASDQTTAFASSTLDVSTATDSVPAPQQSRQEISMSSEASSAQAGHQFHRWSPPGSPLTYSPPEAPVTPGTLIGQLSQQPPVRSELYQSPAPTGATAPAQADRSLKEPSP
ncbi:hypothetical protein [Thermogutta sp.]|uniref:hypothetical protein n=1 Tax=Thermogutta sp. TaxID=1962930 RepID=UPI003C7CD0C9